MPIECISLMTLNAAPFTCQAVAAMTMDLPVIDVMVINIIVIAAPRLKRLLLILLLQLPYIFRHAVEY